MNLQKIELNPIEMTHEISAELSKMGYVFKKYAFITIKGEDFKTASKVVGVKITTKTKFDGEYLFWVS